MYERGNSYMALNTLTGIITLNNSPLNMTSVTHINHKCCASCGSWNNGLCSNVISPSYKTYTSSNYLCYKYHSIGG